MITLSKQEKRKFPNLVMIVIFRYLAADYCWLGWAGVGECWIECTFENVAICYCHFLGMSWEIKKIIQRKLKSSPACFRISFNISILNYHRNSMFLSTLYYIVLTYDTLEVDLQNWPLPSKILNLTHVDQVMKDFVIK